jgi:hypothetical protein
MRQTVFAVALGALALATSCSKSSTPATSKPTPSPSPMGSPADVLYISSASGSCNNVTAFLLPGMTPLGSFSVSGYCAGAFTADGSGNLYAMETNTSSQGDVYEFALGSAAAPVQSQSGLCFPQVPGSGFIAFDDSSGTFYIASCSGKSDDLIAQYKPGNNAIVRTLAEPRGNTTALLTWPRIGFDASGGVWAGFNADDAALTGVLPSQAFVTAEFSKNSSVTMPSLKVTAPAPTADIVSDPAGGVWILYQFLPTYEITPVPYYFKPGLCTFDSTSLVSGDDVRYLLAQQYTSGKLTLEMFGTANPDATGGLHDENTVEMAVDTTEIAYVSYDDALANGSGVLTYDQPPAANGPDGVPARCPDLGHTIVQAEASLPSLGVDSANNLYVSDAAANTVTQYAPGGQSQTAQVSGFASFVPNPQGFGQILVRTIHTSVDLAAAAAARRR